MVPHDEARLAEAVELLRLAQGHMMELVDNVSPNWPLKSVEYHNSLTKRVGEFLEGNDFNCPEVTMESVMARIESLEDRTKQIGALERQLNVRSIKIYEAIEILGQARRSNEVRLDALEFAQRNNETVNAELQKRIAALESSNNATVHNGIEQRLQALEQPHEEAGL